MEWSKSFPDSCPPDDAECRSMTIYRFLKDRDIKPEHFLTVREESPSRRFPEAEKECRACSLSIFTKKEEVISLQRKVPRWRTPAAIGSISSGSGVVKHTPSIGTNNSHHSWWVPVDVKPWTLFNEVIEPPQISS
jgi:hypothetical protein